MSKPPTEIPTATVLAPRLRWKDVYSETELYKAAIRVYTKPVFQWRKALGSSTDGKTFYEFASHGLDRLDSIHRALQRQEFEFRPAVALHYNFNGKHRTLYILPWEERVVDLLLFRILNRRLDPWFSKNSYAYRGRGYGLDCCQRFIAKALRSAKDPQYVVKRDISDYFASVNHKHLLRNLDALIDPADYLHRLLAQRVHFVYEEQGRRHSASVGIPFGTAIACFLANVYLTELDRRLERLPSLHYFRYADDVLLLSPSRETAMQATQCLEATLARLDLRTKATHQADLVLTSDSVVDPDFSPTCGFRHLGLLFRSGGSVALSRDKVRKIQNLFRFAFRRKRRFWSRQRDAHARAQVLVDVASATIHKPIRNVAILDYY